MDLWDPYQIISVIGAKYFLTIVDDFNRSTWTQMLQDKSQTVSAVKAFYAMIETQFIVKILMVWSDNGIELYNALAVIFSFLKAFYIELVNGSGSGRPT